MSTISDKRIIIQMLCNDGCYPGDPPADTIWKFDNPYLPGKELFAVFWPGMICDMYTNANVINPILLFFDGELTDAGREMIREEEAE